jgi:hypothetical protein
VNAFALRPASAYNLIYANHPSLVVETFYFAPRAKLSPSLSCRVSDQSNPFLCLDGSLGMPDPHRVA